MQHRGSKQLLLYSAGSKDQRVEESCLYGWMVQQTEMLRKTSAVDPIEEYERKSHLD